MWGVVSHATHVDGRQLDTRAARHLRNRQRVKDLGDSTHRIQNSVLVRGYLGAVKRPKSLSSRLMKNVWQWRLSQVVDSVEKKTPQPSKRDCDAL